MSSLQTRKSRFAVVTETTEGTPLAPSSGSDYLPIQEDVSIDFSTETLENAELTASIGLAEPTLGIETPTASFSLYLKGSGTSGVGPAARTIYKAAFGNENVAVTERDTVFGSTVDAVEVDAGEGVEFQRGAAMLVQHATSPWEIRPVHAVSTDTLTPGFNLAVAPATGVDLGLSATYFPNDDLSTFDTLTLWNYLSNGGAIEMLAGARPTALDISFSAGELINQSLSFDALEQFWDAIEVDTNNDLDFVDDQGTFAVAVESRFYKDPHELAEAITDAMNAATSETHACTYGDTDGKFTISSSTSTVLELLWSTGANTATTVGDALGFDTSADDTGATTYEADNAQDYSSPQTPVFQDVAPNAAKANELLIGSATDNICVDASSVSFNLANTVASINSICAVSGRSGTVLSERSFTVTATALLTQYEAANARRFRKNEDVRFCYNWGPKSGGNWVKGKCGSVYLPFCKVTEFATEDQDGLVAFTITLQAYVNDNLGEGFLATV